ncbi:type ISP restriction/modification enzyme [Telluribacter humicola]|uniref:type ISP restriction/modification enzyme n=1 Tax=Telluribacter humicola TaxID=1720261 RepID=UPI001A97CF13|nr:type ISP restriction/modification enzyme [Telluribacter humicola]
MAPDLYPQSTIRSIKTDPELLDNIVQRLVERLGIAYISDKEPEGNVCFINSDEVRPEFRLSFSSTDLFDYLYAVLLSLPYRRQPTGIEQTDFSTIPIPGDSSTFWRLVQLGSQLRRTHLLESPAANVPITFHSADDSYMVNTIRYEDGRVYINDTAYFEEVPELVWQLYLGDSQPARQWLKEHVGRTLTSEDIMKYQRVITALTHTHHFISEIDKCRIE